MHQQQRTQHQARGEAAPLSLTNRPKAQEKPTYAMHVHKSLFRNRQKTSLVIQMRLRDEQGNSSPYRFHCPVGTPPDRAMGARDTLLKAVENGLIKTPSHWDHLCERIARKIRRLNERDGIRRVKPGPKPKVLA